MEVSKGMIRIESKLNIPPTEIEFIGVRQDYLTLKYKINDRMYYANYTPEPKMQIYLLFEVINNSPLWNITFSSKLINNWASTFYYDIYFLIKIEPTLISDYINTSLALNSLIYDYYNQTPQFNNPDLTNRSVIPYFDPVKPPADFKLNLYDYQQRTLAKMLQIEKNQTNFVINYSLPINFKGVDILFDPVANSKTNKELKFTVKTTGGVLSDEMGLGKTISSIALIASHPAPLNIPEIKKSVNSNIDKINSRATVVLCPSHLTKQWETEIKRCYPTFKIKTILTKNDYNGLTFDTFINSDIIITSHQFIMNFKFYPTLHYQTCTAASFSFEQRNASVKLYLQDKITKIGFPAIKELGEPIFEFFNFHRIILDEGHEIFGENLGNASLGRYMSQWVSNIDANYYWYVSGTPFVNYTGVKNCARFISLKLVDDERCIEFDYSQSAGSNTNTKTGKNILSFMNKEYIWNNIIDKICVRHRKVDVENQIEIPGYQERLIWLKFTDLERQLYDAKKGKVSNQVMQQLCCHPLIVESSKKIFGDVEVDLAVMQDKLIEYHKSNYQTYQVKLSKLDSSKPEYHMLKKTFETQISESKYLFTILERMKQPDIIDAENCSICMDCLDNPTLTACGHLFCYECLKMCLGDKKRCPMCKADLTGKDLLVMNLKKNGDKEESNPLIQKYGSKLGKLISIIRHLVAQEDSRIIVFSQWDDMLSLVGKTLAENEIENCFVKGNVWSRNSAINKFKSGKTNEGSDNKVIMLSLKNAASGTNLTEATHIFFVEPINATKEETRAIEGQAIARACRVGQKRKIMLMRILIDKTIEEEIYRKNYNPDVVVSFEEQDYMVEPLKPKIVNDKDNKPELDVEKDKNTKTVKPKRVVKKKTDPPAEIEV
jgi:SNF2 family DNA or RNA helicase